MGMVYTDETTADLIWVRFDGPTWTEYHDLLDTFNAYTRSHPTPFCMVFYPTVDMPSGSPLPHIKRMVTMMQQNAKIAHLIVVMPPGMIIAQRFAELSTKLFVGHITHFSMVANADEVRDVFAKLPMPPLN